MKLKNNLSNSSDLVFTLAVGLIAFFVSLFEGFELIRWFFGFLFVFFASGYPATRFLPKKASVLEKLMVASGASLLLTYPASVLTVLVEGQTAEAIFGHHLSHSLFSLLLLSLLLSLLVSKKKISSLKIATFPKLLFIPLIIYIALTFTNLNRADVFGDEYDLGYQAYNLVDGIVAGRKALNVSFSGHPPLAINIKHFSMNILEPSGFDELKDWQFRVSEALVGLMLIIVAYSLTRER